MPVSYTHLDVYKRQMVIIIIIFIIITAAIIIIVIIIPFRGVKLIVIHVILIVNSMRSCVRPASFTCLLYTSRCV